MLRSTLLPVMLGGLLCGTAARADLSEKSRVRAEAAMHRGLAYLASQQNEDGSWSNKKLPALTGLATLAFARSGMIEAHPETIAAAKAFLVSKMQADGGIYHKGRLSVTGGLQNYNTSICMTALHALGDADLQDDLLRARAFVAASQRLDGDRAGGFGYNRKGLMSRPDLQNTVYAMEAMALTAGLEDGREGERVDMKWDKALEFLGRLQNPADSSAADAGGFFYSPADPKAGATTNAENVVVFRSYGSMTYSGMLALIYAQVGQGDDRVSAAFDWAQRHWSLEENPGMGATGLYFFYNVLAKALNAHGVDQIRAAEGEETFSWREELVETVCARQHVTEDTTNGSWVNDESKRYMEGDRVLVTSYALLALAGALGY